MTGYAYQMLYAMNSLRVLDWGRMAVNADPSTKSVLALEGKYLLKISNNVSSGEPFVV